MESIGVLGRVSIRQVGIMWVEGTKDGFRLVIYCRSAQDVVERWVVFVLKLPSVHSGGAAIYSTEPGVFARWILFYSVPVKMEFDILDHSSTQRRQALNELCTRLQAKGIHYLLTFRCTGWRDPFPCFLTYRYHIKLFLLLRQGFSNESPKGRRIDMSS